MKNKIFKIILLLFISNYISSSLVLSSEIKFEAENIETNNEDFITATNNIIIKDDNGIEIYGDILLIDKKKREYSVSKNVVLKDINNQIIINAKKIIYSEKRNIIFSEGIANIKKDNQYEIETKDITFDRAQEKITSKKETIIKDNNRNTFKMDALFINIKKNLLSAKNTELIDKDSNIYEIKNLLYDFEKKKILGKDIVVNKDNKISSKKYLPRIKSNSFKFKEGISEFDKAVYTSCKKRDGCPPWLLKAKKVKHNTQKKTVSYDNAVLEIFDVPILYFPKFFHPDPTVKRQSGFLTPSVSATNSNSYFKLPYFFEISDNSDFTFSPRFYNDQKNIFQGEYRLVTKNSEHVIDSSIQSGDFIIPSNNSRTHFFSKSSFQTEFDYFDFSEVNLVLQSASNDSYLKFNNLSSPIIDSQTTLNSKINFSASSDTLDVMLSAEAYENLDKKNDSDKFEFVLPNFNITKDFITNLPGSLSMTNIGYNKIYDTNVNEKILVNNLSYESLDLINDLGMINNYEVFLKNFNADSENSLNLKNEKETNLQGILQFNSKLPLKKKGDIFDSSLTPIFVAKLSPFKNKNIRASDRIIDYNNIYSINRIASNETLEGKNSLTLGNEFQIFKKSENKEVFGLNLATTFRDEENEDLPTKSSIGQKMSNVVGQMNLNPNDNIKFDYDFLADNNLGQFNYHKFNTTFKVNNFVTSFEFMEESNDVGNESFFSNEISYELNENKFLRFRTRKNKKTDLTEYYNLIYQYKMDCLTAGIEYKKDYYEDGDIKPKESLFFSITLMPFGGSIDLPGINK